MVQDELYLKTLNEHFKVDFTQCESSNIFAYAFSKKKAQLYVAFKNRKIYSYYPVPEAIFANLVTAESKGKFINQNLVKGDYTVTKYEIQES